MQLLAKEDVNTGRQFEFDMAKAFNIFGMALVHCLENFVADEAVALTSLVYYTVVIVMDALFGAGTFMIAMGVGVTYSKHSTPEGLMKRGVTLFLMGYLLNVFRYLLTIGWGYLDSEQVVEHLLSYFLEVDIMQFAGLSLFLLGLFKKIKLPDWGMLIVAVAMSAVGSFVRFVDLGVFWADALAGLFIGTVDASEFNCNAYFPLLNWFIIVVYGYFLGKFLRRCQNTEKYYAIATPVAGAILTIYMAIAIPNRLGMMSGEMFYFYFLTTPETLLLLAGAIFITGIFHYISKLFNEKVKNFITRLSVNLNKTYCIHWVMIGLLYAILDVCEVYELSVGMCCLVGVIVYVAASFLAEIVKRIQDKKRLKKVESNA